MESQENESEMKIVMLQISLKTASTECFLCSDKNSTLIPNGKIEYHPGEWAEYNPQALNFSCGQLNGYLTEVLVTSHTCLYGRAAFKQSCCDDQSSSYDCEINIHDTILDDNTIT